MSEVIIAFSAGNESTYLLQKALEEGHNVILAYVNVTGNKTSVAVELDRTQKIAQLANSLYKGEGQGQVREIYFYPHLILPGCSNANAHKASSVVQQFNVALGLLLIRREMILRGGYPGVWIGWLKEDCFESSHTPWDFTEAQYNEFLALPSTFGKLTSADFRGVRFSAPLWDMKKVDIWKALHPELAKLILGNGYLQGDTWMTYPHKVKEFNKVGIPIVPEMTIDRKSMSYLSKLAGGLLTPEDFGLPGFADPLISELAEAERFRRLYNFKPNDDFVYEKEAFGRKLRTTIKLCQQIELPEEEKDPKPPIAIIPERVENLGINDTSVPEKGYVSPKLPVTVSLIAAVAANGIIGVGNKLPWHLPGDLKYFKYKTLGRPIIMGRKTWDSLGKPLPGRLNIVISKQPGLQLKGAEVFSSLGEALTRGEEWAREQNIDEIMLIGGAQLYEHALERGFVTRAYLTRVGLKGSGDVWFPMSALKQWNLESCSDPIEENGISYHFEILNSR